MYLHFTTQYQEQLLFTARPPIGSPNKLEPAAAPNLYAPKSLSFYENTLIYLFTNNFFRSKKQQKVIKTLSRKYNLNRNNFFLRCLSYHNINCQNLRNEATDLFVPDINMYVRAMPQTM